VNRLAVFAPIHFLPISPLFPNGALLLPLRCIQCLLESKHQESHDGIDYELSEVEINHRPGCILTDVAEMTKDILGFAPISSTPAGNHYFVSVRIDTHRQVSWFFRSIEWRPQNLAARRSQGAARGEQVIHLEIESSPGPLTLSAAMNSKDTAGDQQFRHHFRLMRHFRAKDLTIKCDRSGEVFGPDDILEFFDTHTSGLPGTGFGATAGNGEVRFVIGQ
jgi:hypothetical protein